MNYIQKVENKLEEKLKMKIIKIISEWKRKPNKKFPSHKKKMVEAIVEENGYPQTRHIAVNK